MVAMKYPVAIIGDEFDRFWLHIEQRHPEEYDQMIEQCQSSISLQSKITKVP